MADDIDIGIAVRTDPAAAASVDALRARLTGLRDMLAKLAAAQAELAGGATLEGLVLQANEAAAGINQTIGAFTKLGQAVDASNAKAVAAFREEGLALALYLEELGATDAEINKVAASISRLEQRAGAARFGLQAPAAGAPITPPSTPVIPVAPAALPAIPKIPPIPEATISSFDRVAPKLRTAANAASLLAIAAATGSGSLQSMATAAGAVTIGIGTLLTGPVGGLITALGAIVTLATTAIGLWKEAHKTLDATMRAIDEGEQSRLERIAGADAAQAAAITRQANREKQAVDEGKGTAKQKADAIAAINAAADEKQRALEKKRVDDQQKELQAALDATAEATDKRLLAEEQQQQEALTREMAVRRQALEDRLTLAKQDPDATRRESRTTALRTELDALSREENNERLKIAKDAAEARTALERDTNAQILDLIGQHAAAASLRIQEQYDQLLKNLKQKGVANAEAIARSFLNAEEAKRALDDINRTVSESFENSQNALTRIGLLVRAHQITTDAARQATVDALNAQRDAVLRQIPALEELAEKFPGNRETLAQIDAAKTKLLELTLTIQRTSDQFAELKDTGRASSTEALAGLLQGLTKLGSQDRSQIHALTGELKSAQQELNDLLAIPAEQRTGETNKRISDLRGEIESTTVSLDNAKASITTWRDLFVSALQSIADALVKVSSQMLATAIIERILGLAIGSATPSAVLSGDVPVVHNVAEGGRMVGPGTSTSDSIPANLSNDEFVQPAATNYLYGFDLMEAFRQRQIPVAAARALLDATRLVGMPAFVPQRAHYAMRYAEGGLVASPAAEHFGGEARAFDVFIHDSNDHVVRVVERTLDTSPKARNAVIRHVRGSGRSLGLSD